MRTREQYEQHIKLTKQLTRILAGASNHMTTTEYLYTILETVAMIALAGAPAQERAAIAESIAMAFEGLLEEQLYTRPTDLH